MVSPTDFDYSSNDFIIEFGDFVPFLLVWLRVNVVMTLSVGVRTSSQNAWSDNRSSSVGQPDFSGLLSLRLSMSKITGSNARFHCCCSFLFLTIVLFHCLVIEISN